MAIYARLQSDFVDSATGKIWRKKEVHEFPEASFRLPTENFTDIVDKDEKRTPLPRTAKILNEDEVDAARAKVTPGVSQMTMKEQLNVLTRNLTKDPDFLLAMKEAIATIESSSDAK